FTFLHTPPHLHTPLFPYTTLFRSDAPLVVLDRIPIANDLVGARFGDAEGLVAAARVLTHALLLGAGEERPGDQGAGDHQGDDRERERHAALVAQNSDHT